MMINGTKAESIFYFLNENITVVCRQEVVNTSISTQKRLGKEQRGRQTVER